jgi:hypothetical protein
MGKMTARRVQGIQRTLRLAGIVCLTLILARCGDNSKRSAIEPADSRLDSGTFSSIYQNTIQSECIQCHQPGQSSGVQAGTSLDFTSQSQAYATLTSGATSLVSSIDESGSCQGAAIIVAGNPAQSYFAATLFPDWAQRYSNPGFPNCSPYSHEVHQNLNLSSDEENSIITWIQNGAQNN